MTVHFRDSADNTYSECEDGPAIRYGLYRTFGKRAFDVLFVLAVAPVGLALIFIAALSIALSGQSPFYRQQRVGRDGIIFQMLKLRTMVADAEAVLERYLRQNPAAREEWDERQKLANDPRITPFGEILRRTSLDELPQLWNVLKGDMSIVGPRPMMVEQQRLYSGRSYYELRPGITGPWQVSDRSRSCFADRAGFDNAYHSDLSLSTDLRILVRTVGVVLRCTGS